MSKAKNKPGIHLHKSHHWKSRKTEYFWNFIAKNGREITRSSEVYSSKRSAIKSIQIMANYFEGNQHYYDHTGKVLEAVVYSGKK